MGSGGEVGAEVRSIGKGVIIVGRGVQRLAVVEEVCIGEQ